MSKNSSINVPIEARSIFRVLAIRKVVENSDLVQELCRQFDDILNGIPVSERILKGSKGRKDFLNYKEKHEGCPYDKDKVESMPETHMCKSPKVFFRHFKVKDKKGDDKFDIEFIDYQVPLNSSRDKGEGVIDLLGINESEIYVVEVKKWESAEHPLRAMFEAITFWKMIVGDDNCSGFIKCYNKARNINCKLPKGAIAYPAILVREGSEIYESMIKTDLDQHYKELYKNILEKCHLKCLSYTKNGDKIEIHDFTEKFEKKLDSQK